MMIGRPSGRQVPKGDLQWATEGKRKGAQGALRYRDWERITLQLGLTLQQVLDLEANLGLATEHRADLALLKVFQRDAVGLGRQRYVLHFLYQRGGVLQIVFDELFHFRLGARFLAHIDKDRAPQRDCRCRSSTLFAEGMIEALPPSRMATAQFGRVSPRSRQNRSSRARRLVVGNTLHQHIVRLRSR